MKDEFLLYLRNWESEVNNSPGLTAKEKMKLLLSRETMEGLRITGLCSNMS